MREKFNLDEMLADIRRDEAEELPRRRLLLSQDEISKLLRTETKRPPSASGPEGTPPSSES